MDRDFSSPNFDAARPRSNSSSRVPDYFVSATSSHHYRYPDPIMSQLPPLHPIATTREVPCSSGPEHVVSSPTTVCNSPETNDAAQAALVQIAELLGSLGFGFIARKPRKTPCNFQFTAPQQTPSLSPCRFRLKLLF